MMTLLWPPLTRSDVVHITVLLGAKERVKTSRLLQPFAKWLILLDRNIDHFTAKTAEIRRYSELGKLLLCH